MKEEKITLTILFADITQSVNLYETYGDVQAREIVARALGVLESAAKSRGGRMVKTIGDEVLCTFPNNAGAVQAACDMHMAMGRDELLNNIGLTVKVGVHSGEVLNSTNDVFGDAVNVAARAVKAAKQEQTVITREVMNGLPPALAERGRYLERAKVSGKEQEIDFFEVLWQDDLAGVTMEATGDFLLAGILSPVLVLEHRGRYYEVDQDRPALRIGRDNRNHIVVRSKLASRLHAYIEYRKGKFALCDMSTNGTFVRTQGDQGVYLHRDEILLGNKGIICLGGDDSKEGPSVINFRLDNQ